MKASMNTVLITGGSAGIGFELAKIFSEQGNEVVITGRNKERLEYAASRLPGVKTIASDISDAQHQQALVEKIYNEFNSLNVVINNAGRALLYDVTAGQADSFRKAQEEMLTNYLSVIRLNEHLLPLLRKQPEAAIVNVSSIVAFVPGSLVGYSASKAALHSYTKSLRVALEDVPNVKVFELMPPLVNTEFSKEIGGANGISPELVAAEFFNAFTNDVYEIRVGQTEQLYQLSLSAPDEALKIMNSQRRQVHLEKQ
jgi:uncharacterized oxidoreductase